MDLGGLFGEEEEEWDDAPDGEPAVHARVLPTAPAGPRGGTKLCGLLNQVPCLFFSSTIEAVRRTEDVIGTRLPVCGSRARRAT